MMTMFMMMLIAIMMIVQQRMMIAHITSKQTQPTTNKQNVFAGAHLSNNSPGSSSAYNEQRPARASVEPSHACTSIANLHRVNAHASGEEAHARVLLTCAAIRRGRRQAADANEKQQGTSV
jgi:hypothetical protein